MVTDSVKTDEWKGQKDLQQRETSSEAAVVRLVLVLTLQEGWQIPLLNYLHFPALLSCSVPPPTPISHTHRNHSSVATNGSELIIHCGY